MNFGGFEICSAKYKNEQNYLKIAHYFRVLRTMSNA